MSDRPTLRELPEGEWGRLSQFGHFQKVGGLPDKRYARILVLEWQGQIVGCWMAMNKVLLEGLHLNEGFRNFRNLHQLMTGMVDLLREAEIDQALTLVQTADVATLATRAGFERIPGDLYHRTVKG